MDKYKPGTLVKVREECLGAGIYRVYNRQKTVEHGYLYIIDEWHEGDGVYYTRSLATGIRGAQWFHEELEAHGET